jgi:hypothetical protein
MEDLESKKQTLGSEASTADIIVDLSRQTKSEDGDEEAKIIPIVPTSHVDDYPDGGLVAWLVVLGVRPSIFFFAFREFLMASTAVGHMCHLRDVGPIPRALHRTLVSFSMTKIGLAF